MSCQRRWPRRGCAAKNRCFWLKEMCGQHADWNCHLLLRRHRAPPRRSRAAQRRSCPINPGSRRSYNKAVHWLGAAVKGSVSRKPEFSLPHLRRNSLAWKADAASHLGRSGRSTWLSRGSWKCVPGGGGTSALIAASNNPRYRGGGKCRDWHLADMTRRRPCDRCSFQRWGNRPAQLVDS